MKLDEYLREKSLRPVHFARQVGVPPSTISRLLHGQRTPGLALIQRIREATSGAVTADDFLPPLTPPVPEAAE